MQTARKISALLLIIFFVFILSTLKLNNAFADDPNCGILVISGLGSDNKADVGTDIGWRLTNPHPSTIYHIGLYKVDNDGNHLAMLAETTVDTSSWTVVDPFPTGTFDGSLLESTDDNEWVGLAASETQPSPHQCDNPSTATFKVSGELTSGENPCGTTCVTGLGSIDTSLEGLATKVLSIGVGLGGGLALILMVFGAIRVLTSTGDQQRLNGGREMIVAALAGLLFIIFSTVILKFIGINILGAIAG